MQNNDTDRFMMKLWTYLQADATNAIGGNLLTSLSERRKTIGEHRKEVYPSRCQAPAYVFKWCYQLEALFKRYRFKDDVFSDDDLSSKMLNSFLATQVRIGAGPMELSRSTAMVLQKARTIAKAILGKYDLDKHIELCRFGKNSVVGTALKDSYPDARLQKPITGSRDHIEWFTKTVLPGDDVLRRVLISTYKGTNRFKECDCLRLGPVPKSFKAFRGVMPNTELGVFYTSGLGDYIAEKLKESGIDLNYLQGKHKEYARVFSKSRTHATADLSAASDSFTNALVNRVIPRSWYNVLKFGRIDNFSYKGSVFKMNSFMTMGIGFTFPLQTLIFYSLIEAIRLLLNTKGLCSVFGDDLIYPSKIHPYVKKAFSQCGFVLNIDKTFVRDSFRESCGGDFYKGIDVRPFQPEGEYVEGLSNSSYSTFLYKCVNGLRLRWDPEEIPMTLDFILSELRVRGLIYQVPPSFPDGSGWKVKRPVNLPYVSPVRHYKELWGSSFFYLTSSIDNVRVTDQYPFYWDWLRCPVENVSLFGSRRPVISWKNEKPRKRCITNPRCFEKLRQRLIPYIPMKCSRERFRGHGARLSIWD